MKEQLNDKTCLITGASSGIGYYTALSLAGKGATVIMVSRNAEKLNNKAEEVIRLTGNSCVHAIPCDLSVQADVRRLAGEVLSSFDRLDVLVNNAGVFMDARIITAEGFEMTFAVNHLAPFMLTNLLLDRMLGSSPARIINLVSTYFKSGKLNFKDLHYDKTRYNGLAAYKRSKLANVLFTFELANKLEGTGISVNASDPLGTRSSICKGNIGFYSFIWRTIQPFLRPVKNGAGTTIYLATAEEAGPVSGEYFKYGRIDPSSKKWYDANLSARLWEECEKLTGVSYDEVINQYKKERQAIIQEYDH